VRRSGESGESSEQNGFAWVAQLVERVLGKDEVTGSIPVSGSSFLQWWLKGRNFLEFWKSRAGVTQR
jgi:tryptophan 2,3-dioxygenase